MQLLTKLSLSRGSLRRARSLWLTGSRRYDSPADMPAGESANGHVVDLHLRLTKRCHESFRPLRMWSLGTMRRAQRFLIDTFTGAHDSRILITSARTSGKAVCRPRPCAQWLQDSSSIRQRKATGSSDQLVVGRTISQPLLYPAGTAIPVAVDAAQFKIHILAHFRTARGPGQASIASETAPGNVSAIRR